MVVWLLQLKNCLWHDVCDLGAKNWRILFGVLTSRAKSASTSIVVHNYIWKY